LLAGTTDRDCLEPRRPDVLFGAVRSSANPTWPGHDFRVYEPISRAYVLLYGLPDF
jgi:hypothetical protein